MNWNAVMTALGAAALALMAMPGHAMFDAETICEGLLNFPNDDGTSAIYELVIVLDSHGYALTSTDQDTMEVTVDLGTCTAYAGAGCTHLIEVDGELTGDSYEFRIQRLSGDAYAYQEVWDDGAAARTILTCAKG